MIMVRRWKRVMAFLIAIIFCINCVMNIGVKGIYAENSNKDSNTEEVHTSAEEKEDTTEIEKETTSKAEKNKSDGGKKEDTGGESVRIAFRQREGTDCRLHRRTA